MEVRNCIGFPSTDVGRLCGCGEPYINKWAKYKPVRNNFTYNRPTNWWTAADGSCGLYYKDYDTAEDMVNDIINGVTFWQYLPPTGGTTSPYRLGDFAGYSTDARNPIQCLDVINPFYKDTYGSMSVAMTMLSVDPTYNLQLTDFSGKHTLKNFYPAVVVAQVPASGESLRYVYFMTGNSTISNDTSEGIDVPTTNLVINKSYYVIYCLSSTKQTTFGVQTVDTVFVPAPASNALQIIDVKSGGLLISLIGVWDNNKVTYTINATNRVSGTTASMSELTLWVVYADYGTDRMYLVDGEHSIGLADVSSIDYNATHTISGTVLNSLPLINTKGGKLIFKYKQNEVINTVTEEMGMSN